MKRFLLFALIIGLGCNSTTPQIQVFEDTLGRQETEALNLLVDDFETNLANLYPKLSLSQAYRQYMTDIFSLEVTNFEKFQFQSTTSKELFKQSGLWDQVHRIDTSRAGYQVNKNGSYLRALHKTSASDLLVERYYEARKTDGILQDRIDAILHSNPDFDNPIHKRIVVLEFAY